MPHPGPRGSLFLLTDFGTVDEFAGVVRAVLVREAPGASIVDLTHEVPPFDVRAGALALERAAPHLGPGVVMAVVDPGVGTERRAVAVEVASGAGPSHLVGPDNGLLAFALEALGGPTRAVVLPRARWRPEAGATFDGRDVFAPVAARLWSGADLGDLGEACDPSSLVSLGRPRLGITSSGLETEVLWVDRFGNVQLSARPGDELSAGIAGELEVVAPRSVLRARRVDSFEAVGDLGLLVDSNGRLALVCARGSAATLLGVRPGDVLTLRTVPGPLGAPPGPVTDR